MAEEEKRELSSEEIVQIVQNQAAQIDQLNLMVKYYSGFGLSSLTSAICSSQRVVPFTPSQ